MHTDKRMRLRWVPSAYGHLEPLRPEDAPMFRHCAGKDSVEEWYFDKWVWPVLHDHGYEAFTIEVPK